MIATSGDIEKLLNITRASLEDLHVSVVANVKNRTQDYNDYIEHSITTEFLSIEEFEDLLSSAQEFGIYTTAYFDVRDFIIETLKKPSGGLNVLFETTQKGIGKGKDALLPAFCDLINHIYTGPNAFVNAVTGNKYSWTKFLEAHHVPVPRSWRYSWPRGWTLGEEPPSDIKLICKPIYECASIGIDSSSVSNLSIEYKRSLSYKSQIYKQPLIVQEFIPGYEVEVPIISTAEGNIILPPVGLSSGENEKILGNHVFSFDEIFDDGYSFYSYSEISEHICNEIKQCAENIANLLELNGYSRIDFRVGMTGKIYVIDINAYPHIVKHSSFSESFKLLGHNSHHVVPALVGNALQNYKQNQR